MSNKRYELTDEHWERVKGHILHSKMGRPPKDDRVMLNAILWMAHSGAGWEDLPERVEVLAAKGIHLVSNKESVDTATPTGKLMLTMIGVNADLILQEKGD